MTAFGSSPLARSLWLSLLVLAGPCLCLAQELQPPARDSLPELLKTIANQQEKVETRVEALQTIIRAEATRHILDPGLQHSHYAAQEVVPVLLAVLKEETAAPRVPGERGVGGEGPSVSPLPGVPGRGVGGEGQTKVPPTPKTHLVRRAAAEALLWYGEDDRTVPALIAALKDADDARPYDSTVASCAADSLGLLEAQAKAAVPALIAAAKTRHPLLTPSACRALAEIAAADKSQVAKVVPALTQVMLDKQQKADSRTSAVVALGLLGPNAKEAVPALRQALRDNDVPPAMSVSVYHPYFRREVMDTLRQLGPEAKDAMPELLAILQNKGELSHYREEAVRALGTIGPAARAAVPTLRAVKLEQLSGINFADVDRALWRIEPSEEPDPLPQLLQAVRKENSLKVRLKALADLSWLNRQKYVDHFFGEEKAEERELITVMLEVLRDENPQIRRAVFNVIGYYRADKRLIPALLAALRDEDPGEPYTSSVADHAARTLSGHLVRSAIPALLEATKNSHFADTTSLRCLISIGRRDRKATPVIAAALLEKVQDKSRSFSERVAMAVVMSRLGPAGKAVVPLLREKLKRQDLSQDNCGYLLVLYEIGPGAEAAVPDIIAILQNKRANWHTKQAAAYALGSIGRGAEAAIPALTAALGDSDHRIQEAAEHALDRLRRR